MITKDMYIKKVLKQYPQLMHVFIRFGISGCAECVQAKFETIEQGCEVHLVDCDSLIKAMNDYLVEYEEKYPRPGKNHDFTKGLL